MTTPIETLSTILSDDLAGVNAMIHDRMRSENAPRIPEVTAHLVDAGGKRIRPLLTLAAARMCGYEGAHHVRLATTVEFIHTATLLHDDVVDGSAKRRGRPTANLLWDNKSSVLVGDYLFSRSFQLMVETGSIRVLDILANASAVIAEGEVLQLSVAQNVQTDETTYFTIINGKTAALFAAACEVGGVIADAPTEQTDALRNYGTKLGLAFQIADDVLDYVADGQFGKAIGNDFAERKMTLPLIRAFAVADDTEREFWGRVIARGDQNDDDLRMALKYFKRHDVIASSKTTAHALADEAKSELQVFEGSPLKESLTDLADYVVERLK